MNKKLLTGIIVLLVGAVVVVGTLFALKNEEGNTNPQQNNQASATPSSEPQQQQAATSSGRYEPYDASTIAAEGYDETILFFYAPWCPECRAFEAAIEASAIPDGVQILRVDYDSATSLRQKYGVTLQSTFVSVDDQGNELTQWVGYGKDKSVDAILGNT